MADDLLDFAAQLAMELLDGAIFKAQMQHLKKSGQAAQEDVNAVEAELEYIRRCLRITVDRAEAIIKGADIPEPAANERLDEVRARLKRKVGAAN